MTATTLFRGRVVTLAAGDGPEIDTAWDPLAAEEAVTWFAQRVSIQKPVWLQLDDAVRRRAFTAAGVASLDVLDRVSEQIQVALRDGTAFEDFRQRVLEDLTSEWGREIPGRIETIFRNNVQMGYAAGRYAQAMDPDVALERPWWEFASILDSRTTEICRPLDHVVRHKTDEWWHTHYPPLHHRCRSTVITLDAEDLPDAQAKDPPHPSSGGGVPQEGWGRIPDLSEWRPKADDYPGDLWIAYQKRFQMPVAPPGESLVADGGHASRRSEGPRSALVPAGGKPGVETGWFHDDVARDRGSINTAARVPLAREVPTIELLVSDGNIVATRPEAHSERAADLTVNGFDVELKRLEPGASNATVKNAVEGSIRRSGQARRIIVDARGSGLTLEDANRAWRRLVPITRGKLDYVRVIGDGFDRTYDGFV